jgi:hypothetical protein
MSQRRGGKALKLARRREDDILVKKMVIAELTGGIASFQHPYELEQYIIGLDKDTVEDLIELYAEAYTNELCDAIKYVRELLSASVEVLVPDICLGSREKQTQVE